MTDKPNSWRGFFFGAGGLALIAIIPPSLPYIASAFSRGDHEAVVSLQEEVKRQGDAGLKWQSRISELESQMERLALDLARTQGRIEALDRESVSSRVIDKLEDSVAALRLQLDNVERELRGAGR